MTDAAKPRITLSIVAMACGIAFTAGGSVFLTQSNAGAISDVKTAYIVKVAELRADLIERITNAADEVDALDDLVDAIRRARIESAGHVALKLDRLQSEIINIKEQGASNNQILQTILLRLPPPP